MAFLDMEVMEAIQHLRTRVLAPSMFDRYLPEGVLYDVGWTLWEHPPESGEGIGHANALRVNSGGEYGATITPAARSAFNLNEADWKDLGIEHASLGAIDYEQFHTHYNPNGAATSIVHQNTVFSPEDEFILFADAAARESLRVHFNIGMANNT